MSAVAYLPGARPDVLTLREYLRVSFDESGRERSPEEQHADHVRGVERSRGAFALSSLPAYRETGSASKYARKRREDFDALMDDLSTGRFPDDGLLLWTNSRGSRKVSEWIALIELCEERGKVIVIANQRMRVYDPGNGADRHTLIAAANDAEKYSNEISEQVKRAMDANARDGLWKGGRRPYGYTPGREKGTLVKVEAEAVVIREVADRVLAGESLRSIASGLNARGIRTAGGITWTPQTLRQVIAAPRIAGLMVHRGTVIDTDGPVQWPPIISVDTHRRILAALSARSPHGRRGREPYLLTGVLTCGLCGATLVAQRSARVGGAEGVRRYACRKGPGYKGCGRLVIKAEPVEAEVRRAVMARLDDVAALSAFPAPEEPEMAELNAIAAKRAEYAEAVLTMTPDSMAAVMAQLDAAQRDAEARLAMRVKHTGPLDLIAGIGVSGRPFRELEAAQQKAVIEALLISVEVGPVERRGANSVESALSRLTAHWRV